MSNLLGCQSLEVTPCCSGPAPMIIDAQFGLLTVGKTPRAWSVKAPSRISLCNTGVFVGVKPTEPKPSQPMTRTCSTLAIAECNEAQLQIAIVARATQSNRDQTKPRRGAMFIVTCAIESFFLFF